jgi:hypothetical protein
VLVLIISPGDVFSTDVPTSWTNDMDVVLNMTDGLEPYEFYILQLDDDARGSYNYWNIYGESEYIVTPMKLEVIDVMDGPLPIVNVRRVHF